WTRPAAVPLCSSAHRWRSGARIRSGTGPTSPCTRLSEECGSDMTTEERPEGPRLGPQRDATIEALCEHFADDVLSVEEFERRIDTAHRATTQADLEALLQDLPARHLPAASPRKEGLARTQGYSVTSPERV